MIDRRRTEEALLSISLSLCKLARVLLAGRGSQHVRSPDAETSYVREYAHVHHTPPHTHIHKLIGAPIKARIISKNIPLLR